MPFSTFVLTFSQRVGNEVRIHVSATRLASATAVRVCRRVRTKRRRFFLVIGVGGSPCCRSIHELQVAGTSILNSFEKSHPIDDDKQGRAHVCCDGGPQGRVSGESKHDEKGLDRQRE